MPDPHPAGPPARRHPLAEAAAGTGLSGTALGPAPHGRRAWKVLAACLCGLALVPPAVARTPHPIAAEQVASETAAGSPAPAREETTGVRWGRLGALAGGGALLHWAGFKYFDRAWYQGQKRDTIRWLHDWSGDTYLNMDKGGHFMGGLYMASSLSDAYGWAGLGPRTSALAGTATSWAVMLQIEMRDAYYDQWGFSIPDFAANTAGAAVPLLHALYPATEVVGFKFSYWPSDLYLDCEARAREGRPHTKYAIDDYEGMTFWMTVGVGQLLAGRQTRWPPWLGLALGYGASGMHGSNVKSRGREREYPDLPSARPEVFLALDYDLRHLPAQRPWTRWLRGQANWLHLPAPAVRLYPDLRLYLLYL